MKEFDFDDIKYQKDLDSINSEIIRLKQKINENLDQYFIEDTREVYNTMMKDYNGYHLKNDESEKNDFSKYND